MLPQQMNIGSTVSTRVDPNGIHSSTPRRQWNGSQYQKRGITKSLPVWNFSFVLLYFVFAPTFLPALLLICCVLDLREIFAYCRLGRMYALKNQPMSNTMLPLELLLRQLFLCCTLLSVNTRGERSRGCDVSPAGLGPTADWMKSS